MGILHSKRNRKSYDIAPVVSDKDFSYTAKPKPLPEVKLPAAIIEEETVAPSLEGRNDEETKVQEVQQITALSVESSDKFEINLPAVTTEKTSVSLSDNQVETQDARIPSWVNEETFKVYLTQSNKDFKEILKFHANPAMAPGENYATLMLRVKLTLKLQDDTTQDCSFMLKTPHVFKEMTEMLTTMNFFLVENGVYNDVIPGLEEMYRQAGHNITFGAKSHHLAMADTNINYVMLDDLSLTGYKNANRLECLDMEHTLMVLRKLAQFHAASACHVATGGKYSELFSPDLDNEVATTMMNQLFMSFKKPFLDNLKTYDGCEKYYDAMAKFFDNITKEFLFCRKARPGFFNVLNHGDAWSNNILFKYSDDGKLEDARLVDFQNTNWGSPAQDIFYFLISSTQIDIKLSQYEYFVGYYHQHLTENLNLLKYSLEIPSLKDLQIQMMTYGYWATQTAFITLGFVLLDPTDNAKFENIMKDSEEGANFKNTVYSAERYRKYITQILPWLHNRGFMEVRHTDFDNETLSADKLVQPTTTTVLDLVEEKSEQIATPYPEWVNESLFLDVIRVDFENYQKILKFTVSPGTNAGDNYSSIMLKVDIDIELTDNSTKSISYMLKIPPNGEQAKALIAMLDSFEKEILGYYEIVPQFGELYKQQAGMDVVFGPKCYKLTKETECDTIVLENLRPKGFKNCDRLEGLDMKHCEAVLKKLAQFHAASAYLFATKGNFAKVFERSMFTEETKDMREQMMEAFSKIFLECMEQYDNNEEYIDKVRDYSKDSSTHLMKAYEIDWTKFNVLNHGDCWTNNIMFQYDDKGEISNTYFVDYQLLIYGSPAYDLYYFLLASPKLELKMEQFDYFIRYYHDNLKEHLELLKYPHEIPTLEQLHIDLLDKRTFAINTILGVMAAVLLEPSDSANLEEMLGGNDFKKQMYLNKRYSSHATALFPWLNRRGLLNFKLEMDTKPITNETSSQVPSWIDAEHFDDILKENIENYEKILNISTTTATKSGDNYASTLLRVKIEVQLKDGTTKPIHYILKLGLQMDIGFISMSDFFDTEIAMYSKYLKEFEKMYQDAGKQYVFGPKYYSFKKDVGKEVILLEDLCERNFKCGDRREGLNMEHTKCVLRKLAQFHAASAKYCEINGLYPEIYHKSMHTEESKALMKDMKIDFEGYFKHYEGYEEYKDKLPNLIENFIDHIIRSTTIDPTEFNVLNHGDTWLNNIMFQHNGDGHVDETYFVDYQVCKYGSPARDLWYFLISSTELAIKVECFDYFIKYYHDNLMENLQLLKYTGKIPTLPEFHAIMLKYGYIGYSTCIGVGAICLLELDGNANLGNFMAKTPEGEEFRNSLYLNDKYKAHAAVVLPWLTRRGCLD